MIKNISKLLLAVTAVFSMAFAVVVAFYPKDVGMRAKTHAEFVGIDPEFKKIYDEYIYLSIQNHIVFSKKVTIGFINSEPGRTWSAACQQSQFFREIDVDKDDWKNDSNTMKTIVIFHELTHCMCDRDHDWAEQKEYPSDPIDILTINFEKMLKIHNIPGFMEDGCPLSIMNHILLSKEYFTEHYDYYVKEMFYRCRPW